MGTWHTREEARASNERRARQRGSRQKHRAQGTPKSTSRDDDGPLGPSLARSRSARCRPGARRRRGDPFAPLGILRRHSPTKVSSTLSALLWQVALALVPSALLSPRLPLSGPAFLCYTRNLNGAVRRRRPPKPRIFPITFPIGNIPDWKIARASFEAQAKVPKATANRHRCFQRGPCDERGEVRELLSRGVSMAGEGVRVAVRLRPARTVPQVRGAASAGRRWWGGWGGRARGRGPSPPATG